MVKKYLKINIMILILGVNLILSGCRAQREPQNRNYIMCMGIDAAPEGWRISYGFPDLALLTGTDANSAEPVQVIEAASIREGAHQLDAASDKIADYSQMSVILLGDSLRDSPEKLAQLMEELAEEKDIKRTVMIGWCADTAQDIVSLDDDVNGSIGVFIYELCQNNYEDKGYDISVLEDFLGGRSSSDCVVPVFQNINNRPALVEFAKHILVQVVFFGNLRYT